MLINNWSKIGQSCYKEERFSLFNMMPFWEIVAENCQLPKKN